MGGLGHGHGWSPAEQACGHRAHKSDSGGLLADRRGRDPWARLSSPDSGQLHTTTVHRAGPGVTNPPQLGLPAVAMQAFSRPAPPDAPHSDASPLASAHDAGNGRELHTEWLQGPRLSCSSGDAGLPREVPPPRRVLGSPQVGRVVASWPLHSSMLWEPRTTCGVS